MDLREWNDTLLVYLRRYSVPERLLYFYVDPQVLGEASGLEPEAAVDEFTAAFRRRRSASDPFGPSFSWAMRWRAKGFPGDPDFVADLALSVLAVTMPPIGRANGVYPRLNQLLGSSVDGGAPPGYTEHIPYLWDTLNEWLKGPGRSLGRPTARTHDIWTYQGWARSQALIRFKDRFLIERFVKAEADEPEPPTVEEFRQWLLRQREPLARTLEDPGAALVVGEVLKEEHARYRREGLLVRLRQVRARGLVHYDDWTGEFSGRLRIDPAWVGRVVDDGTGRCEPLDGHSTYLTIPFLDHDRHRLTVGLPVTRRLDDTMTVDFGGSKVLVFRDSYETSGWLQCLTAEGAGSVHVLADGPGLAEVMSVLGARNRELAPQPCDLPGWCLLSSIVLDEDDPRVLKVLGLRPVGPAMSGRPALAGGLKVGPVTYLTGGEPDLVYLVELDVAVAVDGVDRPDAGQPPVSLWAQRLAAGEHEIVTDFGRLTFSSVDEIRSSATGSVNGDWLASVIGKDTAGPDLPVLPRAPDDDCLVLGDTGRLHQVWTAAPHWLQRISIHPRAWDLSSLPWPGPGRPVAAFTRARDGRSTCGRGIPSWAHLTPGERSAARPDQAGLLAEPWVWLGGDLDRREVVDLIGHGGPNISDNAARRRPPNYAPVRTEPDVVQIGMPDNPYDQLLRWVSEAADSTVSVDALERTWEWLAHSPGRPYVSGGWRRALAVLVELGHLERYFDQRQVGAARPILTELPDAAGLGLLSGARPGVLLRRLSDPDDEVVGTPIEACRVHLRTPVDDQGRPAGPAAVYLDWDRLHHDSIVGRLATLGVDYRGRVDEVLLDRLPPLAWGVLLGQVMSASPGRHPRRRRPRPDGSGIWTAAPTDQDVGFYRYDRPQGGPVFAWRSVDGRLSQVDPRTGTWLALAHEGHTALLTYRPGARTLATPAVAPMPTQLGRSLALRSGLAATRKMSVNSQFQSFLVYRNISEDVAVHVASVLGQDVQRDSPSDSDRRGAP